MTTMKKLVVVVAMFVTTAGVANAARPGLFALRQAQRRAVRADVGEGMRIRLGLTGRRGFTQYVAGNGRVREWGVVGPFGRVHQLGQHADGPLP